jgi:hypothetical protein
VLTLTKRPLWSRGAGSRSGTDPAPSTQPSRAHYGSGFWLAAGAFVTAMAFSTVPTPLYVLYQQRDQGSALTVPYAIFAGLLLVAVVAMGFVPETVRRPDVRPRYRRQHLSFGHGDGATTVVAGAGAFVGFAVFGLFTSLAPGFVGATLHEPSRLLAGVVPSSPSAPQHSPRSPPAASPTGPGCSPAASLWRWASSSWRWRWRTPTFKPSSSAAAWPAPVRGFSPRRPLRPWWGRPRRHGGDRPPRACSSSPTSASSSPSSASGSPPSSSAPRRRCCSSPGALLVILAGIAALSIRRAGATDAALAPPKVASRAGLHDAAA